MGSVLDFYFSNFNKQPRQLNAGLIRPANAVQQTQRVQNIHPIRPQQQYRPQNQLQQQRFGAPVLQRIGTVSTRMASPNAPPTIAMAKKAVAVQQPKVPAIQNTVKPQFVTETKTSSTSTDINELDDLENSITAARIHKTPPEPPPPTVTPTQTVGSNSQYIIQAQAANIQQACQKPNFQNQRQMNTHTQQPYLNNPSLDDARKVVTLRTGESMPLTEYKRKIHDTQYSLPQQQLQNLNQSPPGQVVRGTSTRGRGGMRGGTGQARGSYAKKQYRPVGQQQLQQQQQPNQTDQSQHIIEPEAQRESARMLVVLQSGEQRLITFTLPKESCTVQELLEQVGVPFTEQTNIECVTNPGVSIDYLVTVGVTCSGTPSEIISAAENTLQMKQQQQQQQVS